MKQYLKRGTALAISLLFLVSAFCISASANSDDTEYFAEVEVERVNGLYPSPDQLRDKYGSEALYTIQFEYNDSYDSLGIWYIYVTDSYELGCYEEIRDVTLDEMIRIIASNSGYDFEQTETILHYGFDIRVGYGADSYTFFVKSTIEQVEQEMPTVYDFIINFMRDVPKCVHNTYNTFVLSPNGTITPSAMLLVELLVVMVAISIITSLTAMITRRKK